MEFIKDYNCTIHCHPRKANVVANALSRKAPKIRKKNPSQENIDVNAIVAIIRIGSTIVDQSKKGQQQDPQYVALKQKVVLEDEGYWKIDDTETLSYKGKIWVPKGLQKEVMKQAHESSYTMHLKTIKMYQDLRKNYWWNGMKNDIREYVIKCLTCQHVKVKHQQLARLHQNIFIPKWKWESLTMDFIIGLPRTQKGCDSI